MSNTVSPQGGLPMRRLILWGGLLVLLTGLLQAVGLLWRADQLLIGILPERLLPKIPGVVLVELPMSDSRFRAMDVAMSLRGIARMHPLSVLVDGSIGEEETPAPILPGLIDRLRNDPRNPLPILLPTPPSPESMYRELGLQLHGSPSLNAVGWPRLEGSCSPGGVGMFLSPVEKKSGFLPLLGVTGNNGVIGSLWWWSLPRNPENSPDLYVRHSLIFSNRSTLWLDGSGGFSALSAIKSAHGVRHIELDDFLLKMEQKERGTIRADFESLFENSIVILGSNESLARAVTFEFLVKQTSLSRPPFWIQAVLAALCVLFLLLFAPLPPVIRFLGGTVILGAMVFGMLLLVQIGIFLPVSCGIVAWIFFLIPARRPIKRRATGGISSLKPAHSELRANSQGPLHRPNGSRY